MIIEIRELTPENVDQAMQMVTESYDIEVRQGLRENEFDHDFLLQYPRFAMVAEGAPYAGYVAYQNHNQPIGISLMVTSPAYGEEVGLWDWFFISPRAAKNSARAKLPLRLMRVTLDRAKERGAKKIHTFVGAGKHHLLQQVVKCGFKAIEIEFAAVLDDLKTTRKSRNRPVEVG